VSDDTSKPLDAGTFFDRPPPPAWSWVQPALACVACIAFALLIAFGDASTARNLGCSAYFVLGASVFQTALARYTERAAALRREDHERTARRTREWMAFFRKWRERREKGGA
jgi:hypothetical protein